MIYTLLSAVSANGTGPSIDLGDGGISDDVSLEVVTAGTVPALSVQLQGSDDGVNFYNLLGTAISAAGLTKATGSAGAAIPPVKFFRAVLSGYSGTGTVTVSLGVVPIE